MPIHNREEDALIVPTVIRGFGGSLLELNYKTEPGAV